MLSLMNDDGWGKKSVRYFLNVVEGTILDDSKCPGGLHSHFHDILLEEVAKVSEGDIPESAVHQIAEFYAQYYMETEDLHRLKHIQRTIFYHLMLQSDLGQTYQEKFQYWKAANFPTEHIDDMEVEIEEQDDDEIEDGDNEIEPVQNGDERVLDPRAGNVNVVIHEIPFDIQKIIEMFEKLRNRPDSTSIGRKSMKFLMKKMKRFANGQFPLGPQNMPTEKSLLPKEEQEFCVDKAVQDMIDYEKGLNEELNKDRKNKKKKKKERLDVLKNPYPNFVKAQNGKSAKANVWIEEDNDDVDTVAKEPEAKKAKKRPVEDKDESESVAKKPEVKIPKKRAMEEEDDEKPAKKSKRQKTKEANVVKERKMKFDAKMQKLKQKQMKKLEKIKEEKLKKKMESKKVNNVEKTEKKDEWSEPLKEGEIEMFVPSMKKKLEQIKEKEKLEKEEEKKLVKNPFATPQKPALRGKNVKTSTPLQKELLTPGGKKHVVIALNQNVSQEHNEYIEQVKNSPPISFDGSKKPTKGLLKPHCMPSPINPFYKRKLGLLDKTL